MSDMNEYTPDLIELVDNEGNKKNFEIVDIAEFEGEIYYAMIPEFNGEDILSADCELVILKTVEDNGEEILASIEDDDEFDRVSEFFMKRMDELFDEENEGDDE